MTPDKSPHLAIIAAVAANGVIGRNNTLPWRLPEDLKRFRRLTLQHRVIMGRKTHQSLGKPLPDRENVVITQDEQYVAPGCRVVHALDDALAGALEGSTVFCIGGAQLYRACLPRAQSLYLTEIDRAFVGDAYFPEFERSDWRVISRETHTLDAPEGFQYHFVTYQRARQGAFLNKGE